jgi:cytochrome P450
MSMATTTKTTKGNALPGGQHLPPGPRGELIRGILPEFLADPLGYQLRLTRIYGDVVRLRVLVWDALLINHPDYIRYVLQENYRNYSKQMDEYRRLGWILGQGLLTSDGDLWLRQRRLAQPAFHRKRIEAYGTIMQEAAREMLDQWQEPACQGKPVDVAEEMMRVTLRVVGETLFSVDLSDAANAIGPAFSFVNEYLSKDAEQFLAIPRWVPTRRNRQFQAAVAQLNQAVDQIISRRRQHPEDSGDLLSMLMMARDEETGEGMSDRQLRDEVMTLMLAGHETTANSLTWTFYLLSQHPAVAQNLRHEIDRVLVAPETGRKRPPAVADLPQMPYTRMVIEESLRLYPVAWTFGRMALADDEIGGYQVRAGTPIYISTYAVHRHPDFWDAPDTFDPERFTPERSEGRHRFAYIPFSGGPRQCIGNNFAMMEAQLILASVVQRYQLELVPGHPVEPEPLITLRPRYGLPMQLEARGAPTAARHVPVADQTPTPRR